MSPTEWLGTGVAIVTVGGGIVATFKWLDKSRLENKVDALEKGFKDIKTVQEEFKKELKGNAEGDTKLLLEFTELKGEYKGVKTVMQDISGKLDKVLSQIASINKEVAELKAGKVDK